MAFFENPVLQRELLVNLRKPRAFVLLFGYTALLSVLVYFAWPKDVVRIDLTERTETTGQLINLFFLGQFILTSLLVPSFAAGAITGEKERKTYEMLLASPLRPESIVFGKLFAAMCHLAILVFSSLPIVVLCLPLGGVSIFEVLAGYFALLVTVVTFGMISVACSSFFQRTASALVVSYLVILFVGLILVGMWIQLGWDGQTRLKLILTVVPGVGFAVSIALFYVTAARLLYPPDVGSEGKEVVDLDMEQELARGLVIQRDQFPDRLFAPPRRDSLMNDGTNPVYDKEMRSEIFGQGTLMLRLAIQISMFMAIFFMAAFLYIWRWLAPFYIGYVILFNMLIGPVFSAGSVTGERERQTLDLLLTTVISPWKILWGKFLASLRVSSVLTSFLMWPVLLAFVMLFPFEYHRTVPTFFAYAAIFVMTCVTTSNIGLYVSTLFQKTSVSLIMTYLTVAALFLLPIAVHLVISIYLPDSRAEAQSKWLTVTSPFMAAKEFPLYVENANGDLIWEPARRGEKAIGKYPLSDLVHFGCYTVFTILLNTVLFIWTFFRFVVRWRVSISSG